MTRKISGLGAPASVKGVIILRDKGNEKSSGCSNKLSATNRMYRDNAKTRSCE